MSNTARQGDAEGYEMPTPVTRRSRAELEHLLDGRPVRQDALAQLISAARTPEARVDPAGLAAALAEFRSVSSPLCANHPRRNSMIKNVAAKMVAAKLLLIGGVAVAATGGVAAAAASTGHLPSPLPHSSHAAAVAVAAVASHRPTAAPTSSATSSSASSSSSEPSSESASPSSEPTSAHPSATPSPSLPGLCRSWLARPHMHGKADTNPAFTVLVTAAGGTDSVDGYCTALLATAPGHPKDSSSPTATPDASSSDESDEPGDGSRAPSAVPSHSHPSGKPSAVPSPSTGR
jgi:hypothetical protein